jgi:nicotinate phosphoribosyltransferase
MTIISSLLDQDFYKFSMCQAALHQFPTTSVEYEFKCRNESHFTEAMCKRINDAVDIWCELKLSTSELKYLSSIRFFKKDFIDFLKFYQPNREHIKIWLEDDELKVKIAGPWYLTILFEVPVLAIINEVYFDMTYNLNKFLDIYGVPILAEKIRKLEKSGITFSDFGTRRRISKTWQNYVVGQLSDLPNFSGTSNVYFAWLHNVKPIGTMAHEWIMAGAGQDDVPLVKSQQRMFQAWVDEYRGDLGIALTDTYGVDAFIRDFDLYFAKLYDGVRHDSGSPLDWTEKMLAHYKSLGIDPATKTFVYSDGLTVAMAISLDITFKDSAKLVFGIGTHFTNDFPEVTPLNIVIKPVSFNGRPVAKISDSAGKTICKDEEYISYVKKVFKIT